MNIKLNKKNFPIVTNEISLVFKNGLTPSSTLKTSDKKIKTYHPKSAGNTERDISLSPNIVRFFNCEKPAGSLGIGLELKSATCKLRRCFISSGMSPISVNNNLKPKKSINLFIMEVEVEVYTTLLLLSLLFTQLIFFKLIYQTIHHLCCIVYIKKMIQLSTQPVYHTISFFYKTNIFN